MKKEEEEEDDQIARIKNLLHPGYFIIAADSLVLSLDLAGLWP